MLTRYHLKSSAAITQAAKLLDIRPGYLTQCYDVRFCIPVRHAYPCVTCATCTPLWDVPLRVNFNPTSRAPLIHVCHSPPHLAWCGQWCTPSPFCPWGCRILRPAPRATSAPASSCCHAETSAAIMLARNWRGVFIERELQPMLELG